MIEKLFTAMYADENKLTLRTILVMSYFLVMKWVFLTSTLIILILMILIMKKMVLILLFLSDFWLVVLNLKNAEHLKNDK